MTDYTEVQPDPYDFEFDDNLESRADGLFSIGQDYEEKPAKTIYCSRCGGKEFYAGTGSWFTAIMCVSCKWEKCIHEG